MLVPAPSGKWLASRNRNVAVRLMKLRQVRGKFEASSRQVRWVDVNWSTTWQRHWLLEKEGQRKERQKQKLQVKKAAVRFQLSAMGAPDSLDQSLSLPHLQKAITHTISRSEKHKKKEKKKHKKRPSVCPVKSFLISPTLAVSMLRTRRKSSSGSSSSSAKKKKVTLPAAEAAFPHNVLDELAEWAKWAKWAGWTCSCWEYGEAHSFYDVVCADEKAQKKEAWHLYRLYMFDQFPSYSSVYTTYSRVAGCYWMPWGHLVETPSRAARANQAAVAVLWRNLLTLSQCPSKPGVLGSTHNVSSYFIFHQPFEWIPTTAQTSSSRDSEAGQQQSRHWQGHGVHSQLYTYAVCVVATAQMAPPEGLASQAGQSRGFGKAAEAQAKHSAWRWVGDWYR